MDDQTWKRLVWRIANNDYVSSMVTEAANYLWKTPEQFKRLDAEAHNYTRFLCEKTAKSPCYILRRQYREAVLKEHQQVG